MPYRLNAQIGILSSIEIGDLLHYVNKSEGKKVMPRFCRFFYGITMNELFFDKTVSQFKRPSPEKGPRKFPLIESDSKCRNITLHIILITFHEVCRFLTDNWVEYRRFPKV